MTINTPCLLGNMNTLPSPGKEDAGEVKALHSPSPVYRLPRPMLAKTYGSAPSCLYTPGMFVQPKLNGIRMMYCNGVCWSRDLEVWRAGHLQHIRDSLSAVGDIILDGELYLHGLPLQQINSQVAVNRTTPHKDEAAIEYHVFDYVSREPLHQRLANLSHFLPVSKSVKLVPSYMTRSPEEADHIYQSMLSARYEGMMYRHPTMPYAIVGEHPRKDNRVAWLLKRKEWLDLDAIIVGVAEGKGKHANTLSTLRVKWRDKVFEISSGLTDIERAELWQYGRLLIGCAVKIEYRELTGNGTPFHGRIVCVEIPKTI